MKKLYISTIFVLITFWGLCFGYQPSSIFLVHPQSAEQAAMAEVGTGLPNPTCLQFNPAATITGDGLSANLMYNFHFQGIRNNAANLYWRKKNFLVGTDFFLSNISGIEKRSAATEEPEYEFTSHHLYLGLLGGYTVLDRVTVSMRMKMVYERIDYETASTEVYDFGLLVRQRVGNYMFTAGGAILNFGRDFKFKDLQFRMPKVNRAGIGFESQDPSFRVGFDLVKPEYDDLQFSIGGEYDAIQWLNLKLGYMYGHDTRNISSGFTLSHKGLTFNYAFIPYSTHLGFSHLFSVGYGYN